MSVLYGSQNNLDWRKWVIPLIVIASLGVAYLVYTILVQKHIHTDMVGKTRTQEACLATERNMTVYFAHELRNPLGAIDSALLALPDEQPEANVELLKGMKLCTGFMSSIMNNLLDVRQMEEVAIRLDHVSDLIGVQPGVRHR